MAEPTEADRKRATNVWTSIVHRYDGRGEVAVLHARLTEVIAQALADERERARAAFLALAAKWDDAARVEYDEPRLRGDITTDDDEIRADWLHSCAELVRRAAEGAGQ